MRLIKVYIITIFIGLSIHTAIAAPAIKHSHNGRIHTHILPATGVKHFHKHMHDGRAHIHPYSAEVGFNHSHKTNNPRAKAWENTVKHQHGGRFHSHPLPPSGIKHQHRHRHGGRSHIHPLPVNGADHFHDLNTNKSVLATSENPQPLMITDFKINQQIDALLKASIKGRHQVKAKQKKQKPNIKPAKKINLRDKKYSALLIQAAKSYPTKSTFTKSSTPKSTAPKKAVKKKQNKRKKVKPIKQKSKPTPQQNSAGDRQFSIALRYENGTGVKKNLPQAVNWYLRSAKQGHVKAQFNLASMYENGDGTKRNIPQAIRWYTTAAENGEVNAQLILGNRYARGLHVPKDIKEAAEWYKKAADQGDMRGRANLNHLTEEYKEIIKR